MRDLAVPLTSGHRHEVRIHHRVGALTVDVDFQLTRPWTILFGPSGSGKTTILRSIAGLVRPDEALISGGTGVDGTVYVDTRAGVFVPAHRRGFGFAPQQASLFPHLSLLENVAYGLRGDGKRRQAQALLGEELEPFEIAALGGKRPAQLSGGEAQRVNLARACAAGGSRLLLLDEPFTGLDHRLRSGILAALASRAERTQILSVTHDIAEVFEVGAEVIKLDQGRIIAQGPVETVLAEERLQLLRRLGAEQMPLHSSEPYLGG